jgi:radical SAM protein with 4Fe4S-binding SPASM domain
MNIFKNWSVDPKCYELAEHFATGDNFSDEEIRKFSQEIQDCAESFLRFRGLTAQNSDRCPICGAIDVCEPGCQPNPGDCPT